VAALALLDLVVLAVLQQRALLPRKYELTVDGVVEMYRDFAVTCRALRINEARRRVASLRGAATT